MFRLLALVATTLAAPQYPYAPAFGGYYPGYLTSIYGAPPAISYNPLYAPALRSQSWGAVPVVQAPRQDLDTRAFFGAGALQEINGNLAAHDAAANPVVTTATQVIEGTVSLTQNALTNVLYNNDAQYKIYVRTTGMTDLTGQNVIVAIGDNCLVVATNPAAPTAADPNRRVATLNVPAHFNGFYLSGATTGFNLDGMNGKVNIRTNANFNRIQILNAAGTAILGCNDMNLA